MTSQAAGERLCSNGHGNPSSHRYCTVCGEKLTIPEPVQPRVIGDRYRIMREIGRGGFGHTYLAEDTNRFNETCVLKEFAPELDHPETLHKAKELFSREAEVLYRLQHPQIPRFREWFMDEKLRSLFLAQDYVTGPTYFALLQERKAQGIAFNEREVLTFLHHSLPILDYIHEQGVIHRDISPDNLICRHSDRLPVLIDFGGVKQVTITLGSLAPTQKDGSNNITLIGKPAYAPEEQLRLGQVNASSDIYSLGVTALSLLMGKEPQEFFDAYRHRFNWQNSVQVQSHFAAILNKMTAPRAGDRYRSAAQVLSDLPEISASNTPEQPKTSQTILVSPARATSQTAGSTSSPLTPGIPAEMQAAPSGTAVATLVPAQSTAVVSASPGLMRRLRRGLFNATMSFLKGVLVLAGLMGLAGLGWWLVQTRLANLPGDQTNSTGSSVPQRVSEAEQNQRQLILNRVNTLKIPSGYFNRVTNEAYYLQYPEQQGRLLDSDNPEDETSRTKWYGVADQILNFSDRLSNRTRSRLGRLDQSDLNRIEQVLREQEIDPQIFLRDVEQDLLRQLPMYRNQNLGRQQVNQLRLALASERALSR
ncbi:MAG: serine/threonine-protein kinase [Cyanobacteria bacterium P01_F01_bin.42]